MITQPSVEDETGIRRALTCYTIAIDRRDRTMIRGCFADDLELHLYADGVEFGAYHDAESYTDLMINGHMMYRDTMHVITNMFIWIEDGVYKAETYVQPHLFYYPDDVARFAARGGDDDPHYVYALGRYYDTMEKLPDRWVIKKRDFHAAYVTKNWDPAAERLPVAEVQQKTLPAGTYRSENKGEK